jgi:MFS family permease
MNNNFKKYIIFWLSQAISQLGSSMTSFALILWAYAKAGKAMTVSLMSFSNYMPYIIVSLLAGTFVDRHRKKEIMLVTDSIAAICSMLVFALCSQNLLQIWHIYLVNCIIGSMNAFQGPVRLLQSERLCQRISWHR